MSYKLSTQITRDAVYRLLRKYLKNIKSNDMIWDVESLSQETDQIQHIKHSFLFDRRAIYIYLTITHDIILQNLRSESNAFLWEL